MRVLTRRILFTLLGLVGLFVAALAIALLYLSRNAEPWARERLIAVLSDRFDADVTLDRLHLSVWPAPHVSGERLSIRMRDRPDAPPMIEVGSFALDTDYAGLFEEPRRVNRARLTGLRIVIPPSREKDVSSDAAPRGGKDDHAAPPATAADGPTAAQPAKTTPPEERTRAATASPEPVIPQAALIKTLEAGDTLLRILPRQQGKTPKDFQIHRLQMQEVGMRRPARFTAALTNPVPRGEIETTGSFGPWERRDPGRTPLSGDYTFRNADLNTIKGIAGTLSSQGRFSGVLERIGVTGTTRTPDFSLDISNHAVPLDTTFDAVVDGTNGDTILNRVDASFLRSALVARGKVAGTPGVKGRTVQLDVTMDKARIEDLLRLATKARQPLMVGNVRLRTSFLLPPGDPDVLERLQLRGTFGVGSARFTSSEVQQKLNTLSRRGSGISAKEEREAAEPLANAASDLRGNFVVRNATLSLSQLAFALPGAKIQMQGSYGLRSEVMNFEGTLRLDAKLSQTQSGFKSLLLKLVDPLFARKGAGTLLPIHVRGTREHPDFGVDVKKALKRSSS